MLSFYDVSALFDFAKDILFQLRARLIETNLSRTETILRDALAYVDHNYSDPTLSLNKVCEHLDISISYLSMLMKREKETTFNKYVVSVRMEKAKELLKRTNHKIIEIATMCGYNEVYYFSHSFKKYTGVSPKQYREKSHV
jgi:two-component system, response regulator YesN